MQNPKLENCTETHFRKILIALKIDSFGLMRAVETAYLKVVRYDSPSGILSVESGKLSNDPRVKPSGS